MSFILCLLQKETVTKALCGRSIVEQACESEHSDFLKQTLNWKKFKHLWLGKYFSQKRVKRYFWKINSLSTIKYKYTYKLKYVIMYLYIISCINFYNIPMCTHRCMWYVLQCTYIPTYNHPNFWSVYMHIYTCACLYYIYHHVHTHLYMCVCMYVTWRHFKCLMKNLKIRM